MHLAEANRAVDDILAHCGSPWKVSRARHRPEALPTVTEILLFVVVFTAAFVQGVVGFGFGLVSMALLPLFVSEHFAVPFIAPYTFFTASLIAWQLRREVRWALVWAQSG
jgi:uncharacterized membrane protein YfcA